MLSKWIEMGLRQVTQKAIPMLEEARLKESTKDAIEVLDFNLHGLPIEFKGIPSQSVSFIFFAKDKVLAHCHKRAREVE